MGKRIQKKKPQVPAKTNEGVRPNGKAWKKNPKKNKSTGKTIDGYSPAKLAERAQKRKNIMIMNRDI